uniref:Gypsy retrotransposon integrase-like protein 1 n=1 Tax=Oreochromis niloticus TaxID=8128 RepID=A0A669BA80_ORENI
MEKSGIQPFACYTDPAMLGPRWTRWLTSFELFADGKGLILTDNATDAIRQRRRALLLHLAGQDVQDVFSTLPQTGEAKDYTAAVTALNTYFVPQVNAAYARQTFHKLSQTPGETVQQFCTRLRRAAKDCDFQVDNDNQIQDAILSKCTSEYVRRKLLEEGPGLTLTRTLEVASHCERVEEQMAAMSVAGEKKGEDTVSRIFTAKKENNNRPKRKMKDDNKTDRQCYRCGYTDHMGKDPKCPARGQTCHKCNGKDHFSKMCRTKRQKKQNVNAVEQDDYAFTVNDDNVPEKLTFSVGGIELKMFVDSGATSNVKGENIWEKLKAEKIKCHSYVPKKQRNLYAYSSAQALTVKGAFRCEIKIGDRAEEAEFIVIRGNGEPLLGKKTAIKLGVLKIGENVAAVTDLKHTLKEKYPKVFKGVGKLNTKQISLYIDPNVKPVAQPLRRIPYHLRDAVEKKINELIDMDIIERVEGPTLWVNPVVVLPKKCDKDIRMCLDMRKANEAIIRERYPIPTVDEILQGLNGSAIFTKLDLKWGYHQLELTPESREITTFAVHNGVYRYKRLIFGVSSASEQYQHEIANALAGIEGVENISDDVIIHAPDQETHDKRLHAVMKRLSDCGLTLSSEKCQFNMDRFVFMGILLTQKGIGPTEERVRAVVEAQELKNATEVRSFLGLVGFSSRFIPQFATLSEPLRRLTRKEITFTFGQEQKQAFERLKTEVARAGTLAYFDKEAPTRVIADASPVGLGAVLIQIQNAEEVPVCYVSRSLTDCERRYSQTEREALALVWACERLHPYVYDRKFDLITDHKPLEVIYSQRSKPCARIERWVLRLQPYDFKVVHIAGKQNIADSLSRLLSDTTSKEVHKHESEEYVRFVAVNSTPKALTTREVKEASATDSELTEVRRAIENGHFEKCKTYAPIANELCVIGYIVLRGTRIVLPAYLRAQALSLAHEGHLGIVGTKQHLRKKVWWPGMDKAEEKFCKACHGCQIVARPDPPEPLRNTLLPDRPWRDVAVDLLGPLPSNHSILVLVDYYSRYYEYDVMSSTTAEKVIDSIDCIFSGHGLPVTIKSDNGPQFKSELFREYCETNGIKHIRTTPKWAQANGQVERQNASLMKRIRIAQAEGLDWKRELRKNVTVYRSIEHPTTSKSPAELLFNRKMRGKLPNISEAKTTELDVRDRDAEQKGKSNISADERRGAEYSKVDTGDTVLVEQDKVDKFTTPFSATPHQVVSRTGNQVIIESPTGARYHRNTTHVKKYETKETREGHYEQNTIPEREEGETPTKTDTFTPTPQEGSQGPERSSRSQRAKRIPERFRDFVVK